MPLQPTGMFKCILPAKKPLTTPSGVYHTPAGNSKKKTARKPPYPAWPLIENSEEPGCLIFLWRALYELDLGILVEPEKAETIAKEYVSRPEVITPEIRQQVLAMVKAHHNMVQSLGELLTIDVLSPGGEYAKKSQLPINTNNYLINLFRTLMGGHVDQSFEVAARGALHGLVYGYLGNFPGVKQGDFTFVFSFLHEMAHWLAKLSHSAVVQEQWAITIHKTLDMLINYPLASEEISELWAQFWKDNDYASRLAQKFEPIEESFATYMAMYFLPTEVRHQIEATLEKKLKEKHWYKIYKDFVESCDYCLYLPFAAALFVFEAVCLILEQANIKSQQLLSTFAKIRKVIWSHAEIIKQSNGSNLSRSKLEDMAQSAAAEEINDLLKKAGIGREVYWSAIAMAKNTTYGRLSLSMMNDFSLSEEELRILFAPVIKLKGKPALQEITPVSMTLGFRQEDEGRLSPAIRVLCESLRQQLSMHCGVFCAFARKGEPCCGLKEAFQRLYERLPEKDKKHFNQLNCAAFR